jgi:hypothetical protein
MPGSWRVADLILDVHTLFGPVPPRGAEDGVNHLLELLDRHNVAGAVTLSTRGLFYSASAGNRETIYYCEKSGNRLLPAAVVDPRSPSAPTAVRGARLLCFLPATQNWPIVYAPLRDLLQTFLAKGGSTPNVPAFWEASRVGDATAIAQLLKETDYPAPVLLGSVNGATLMEAVSVARANPRIHVVTNEMRGLGEVAFAVEKIGSERVLFGSGAPNRSLGSAAALVRAAGLSPEEEALIFNGNARRLLVGGSVAE